MAQPISPAKLEPIPDKAGCQSIYWNLLELIEERPQPDMARFYVRELYQTERCDAFKDFKPLRESLESHMEKERGGAECLGRIRNFKEEPADTERATQAVVHYWYWHRRQLRTAISWPQSLYYWTWFKAERMFAFVGLGGTVWAAGRGLAPIIRANSHKMRNGFPKPTQTSPTKDGPPTAPPSAPPTQ